MEFNPTPTLSSPYRYAARSGRCGCCTMKRTATGSPRPTLGSRSSSNRQRPGRSLGPSSSNRNGTPPLSLSLCGHAPRPRPLLSPPPPAPPASSIFGGTRRHLDAFWAPCALPHHHPPTRRRSLHPPTTNRRPSPRRARVFASFAFPDTALGRCSTLRSG